MSIRPALSTVITSGVELSPQSVHGPGGSLDKIFMIGTRADSLAMADLRYKSAIFRSLGRQLGATASREPIQVAGRMAQLLVKSANL